jgi:homoserine kinase
VKAPIHAAPAQATAFAPATVANVAVGFDVLGFAIDGAGDEVRVRRIPAAEGVRIEAITGVVPGLPDDPRRNTASVALLALLERRRVDHGFAVAIRKGIPLGSGMGGSAASAVAAVVAANRLLGDALADAELLRCAVAGEAAASGAGHGDNAAACLYGGLTAVVGVDPPRVVRIPVPARLLCVLVRPHVTIETRAARQALRPEVGLETHVAQSMDLCSFLAGCYTDDLERIRGAMVDRIAEPTRAALIPGFADARAAALREGALGFSISGSGPSVFAWADAAGQAQAIGDAVAAAFRAHGVESDRFVGPIRRRGAIVLEPERAE